MRAPLRADFPNILRCRPFSFSVRALYRVLNSEIELRQDVAAVETKHQEHLRGPAADAFDLNKVRDQIVVVHTFDGIERQIAARHLRGKVPHVADFLARQSGGAEIGVTRHEDCLGGRDIFGIQGVESRENRRRGLSRQLLIDD